MIFNSIAQIIFYSLFFSDDVAICIQLELTAHSKATLGDRSFSSSSVWNSIPNDVRCAPSLSSFKSRLKTYLFRSVYKD